MRKKPRPVDARGGPVSPVLPAHLADSRGLRAAELRRLAAERRDWFTAHGINPGDWSQVYPILRASWQAHNVPRPRRLVIKETVKP